MRTTHYILILALMLIASAFVPTAHAETNRQNSSAIYIRETTPEQRKQANTQMIGTGLVLAGFVGAFVSYIYFIVRAFSVSPVWGVFMLLFNGITTLFFCLFEFERARRPLGILLLSIAAIVGGFYVSHLGMAPR